MGDHGGILVATKYYKLEGPTNELLYSTDDGTIFFEPGSKN